MSISQFGPSGETQIPAGWALPPDRELSLNSRNAVGNDIITAELQKIDHDIETLLELRASLTGYGLAKVTESRDVTDMSGGLVLSARENNANVPGTLRNEIEKQKEFFSVKGIQITDRNTDCIENDYSFGFTSGNIGVLCIDTYFKNAPTGVEIPLFKINRTLPRTIFVYSMSSLWKVCCGAIDEEGNVTFYPLSNSGSFNSRIQLIFQNIK